MENLIFSLNATLPIFIMILLGLFFKKINWISEEFASKLNTFVFKALLPVLVFYDLAKVDFQKAWDTKFVLFCFAATALSILVSALISCLWKDKSIRGEYIQASYRSSAAILGIAFIQNIYGDSTMGPLMIIGSVPLYNIMAVVVLSVFQPEQKKLDGAVIKKTLKGIVTNPILIGIAVGLLWSALRIPMPQVVAKVSSSLGSAATPLGLMAMGASFDIHKAFGRIKPSLAATATKLVGFCAVFLPLAVAFGFRNEQLVAILIMLGSATTVSCYVMARNMGHEGTVTSSTVMLTTMLCSLTLTFWLFLLRSLGFI